MVPRQPRYAVPLAFLLLLVLILAARPTAGGTAPLIELETHAYADPVKDGTPVPVACDGSTVSLPRIIADVYVTSDAPQEILWAFTFGIVSKDRKGNVQDARAWDQISRRTKVSAGRQNIARDTQQFAWPLPLPAGLYFFTVHIFEGSSDTCYFRYQP